MPALVLLDTKNSLKGIVPAFTSFAHAAHVWAPSPLKPPGMSRMLGRLDASHALLTALIAAVCTGQRSQLRRVIRAFT